MDGGGGKLSEITEDLGASVAGFKPGRGGQEGDTQILYSQILC